MALFANEGIPTYYKNFRAVHMFFIIYRKDKTD